MMQEEYISALRCIEEIECLIGAVDKWPSKEEVVAPAARRFFDGRPAAPALGAEVLGKQGWGINQAPAPPLAGHSPGFNVGACAAPAWPEMRMRQS